ncbi:MAG: methylated-DNA--[protein]-cysteine S-methyltransferase [Candidatus Pedobacter colombiensis]|uniref:Methylated-DNA--protein-cysteine methyltransferase n=1 Tax=Candidatus Pedobacter colombiensis TaxID=3121371 RepID=A0AAJ6B6D8_9SPHI|nr:methylated-DNA--[protein]-cysteine S-methyltransferase [Pedobacter sp.]WEK18346.1 MAG: methylated-DNA--[protein]-cysteine S-methyltransferase [Pedobacter sp.]
MANQYCTIVDSPIGELSIFADDDFVNKITFKKTDTSHLTENKISKLAASQLSDYFEGKLQSFDLPMSQSGTDFQQNVWKELTTIKYGTTISYLQFSTQLNNPLAIRAIAAANGKNELAIVIPCHRVIGSNGKLVGYAGELWRKQWLLDHEREISKQGQMTLRF